MTKALGTRRTGPPPLRYWAEVTAVVIAVIAFAMLVFRIRSVATSVFLGLFLAIAAEPSIAWLERRGLRRGWAVTVLALGILLVLSGLTALLLYPAIKQVGQFVEALPDLVRRLIARLEELGVRLDDPAVQERLQDITGKLPSLLGSSLGAVYGILGGVLSTFFTVLTVVALALYFMVWMPRLRSFAARALVDPERVAVMNESLARIGGYVTGQIVVSLVAGVTSGVVLGLLGVPYAPVLGLAVAMLDAVPQVGATIGAVVCAAVALTESLTLGLVTLVFLLLYQQFENYVLAPRVFSRAVDLSPVAAFIAVLVGASALGPVGAVTALPVAAALKVVLSYVFRVWLGKIDSMAEPAAAPNAPEAGPPGGAGVPGPPPPHPAG